MRVNPYVNLSVRNSEGYKNLNQMNTKTPFDNSMYNNSKTSDFYKKLENDQLGVRKKIFPKKI